MLCPLPCLPLPAALLQRCSELASKSSSLLASSASEAVQRLSGDQAASLRSAVAAALAAFDDENLRRLIAIRTSATYVDRLAAALQKKAGQEAKCLR